MKGEHPKDLFKHVYVAIEKLMKGESGVATEKVVKNY